MRATFFDQEDQARLERDGYAVIPFLDEAGVAELRRPTSDSAGPPATRRRRASPRSTPGIRSTRRPPTQPSTRCSKPHLRATFDRQRALPSNFWSSGPAA